MNNPRMAGYHGKPCVYIRMVNNSFYIGKAKNLWKRHYDDDTLEKIIYIEEFNSVEQAELREKALISTFSGMHIRLANKVLFAHPFFHIRQEKEPTLRGLFYSIALPLLVSSVIPDIIYFSPNTDKVKAHLYAVCAAPISIVFVMCIVMIYILVIRFAIQQHRWVKQAKYKQE